VPTRTFTESVLTSGSPGEKIDSAKRAIDDNIKNHSQAAQKELGGKTPENVGQITGKSLDEFGQALHTATDRTSPTHTDSKGDPMVWYGIPTNQFEETMAAVHVAGEQTITDEQMKQAVNAAQELFKSTYGEAAYKQAVKQPEATKPPERKKPEED
jgi:hypothetical protein